MLRLAARCKLFALATLLATAGVLSTPVAAADSGPAFTIANDGGIPGNFFPDGPYPLVARSDSGDFIVVYFQTTNNVNHTYARLYHADATPKGPAFEVGSNLGWVGSVAMAPSGAFAIAWSARAGAAQQVRLQRYAADGAAQGSLIDAGAAPTFYGTQNTLLSTPPLLAMDHDGDFAVAWSTQINHYITRSVYAQSSKTYAAVYRADGSVLKARTVVDNVPPKLVNANSGTVYNNNMLEGLAMDADGDLAMVLGMGWDAHNIATQTGVKLLNPQLESKGSLQPVAEVKEFSAVAMDAAGNYALAWRDPADDTVHVSRFAASAAPLGVIGPLGVPTPAPSLVETPTLSMAPSGSFVVTWGRAVPSSVSNFTSEEKHAQYFHADGSPNGDAFVIDADTAYLSNTSMATAVDAGGNLVSVWTAYLKDPTGTTLESESIIGRLTTAP